MINPQHLLTLAYVSQTKNLSETAKLLGKTQPAITSQLKVLSAYVGERVTKRLRYGITLTPIGLSLLKESQQIVKLVKDAEHIIKEIQNNEGGIIRIGTSSSIASYLMPRILGEFYNLKYKSQIIIDIHITKAEILKTLYNNQSDVVLFRGTRNHVFPKHIVIKKIFDNEVLLIVSPHHQLSKIKKIKFKELENLEVIKLKKPSGTQKLIDENAKKEGVKFITKFTLQEVEAVKEAVFYDLGATFLSKLSIERQIKNKTLIGIKLTDITLERPVMMAFHRIDADIKRIQNLINCIEKITSSNEANNIIS